MAILALPTTAVVSGTTKNYANAVYDEQYQDCCNAEYFGQDLAEGDPISQDLWDDATNHLFAKVY